MSIFSQPKLPRGLTVSIKCTEEWDQVCTVSSSWKRLQRFPLWMKGENILWRTNASGQKYHLITKVFKSEKSYNNLKK